MSDTLTATVKALALEAGFSRVGIAPAGLLPAAGRLREWLAAGCHGEMAYMESNLPERLDPSMLVPVRGA